MILKQLLDLKTDSELNRAIFLFEMIDRPPLVKTGTAMTNVALTIHLPVEGLSKKPFSTSFVVE